MLKPFLGINITEDKSNEAFNGQEFVAAKVSSIQADMLEKAVDRVEAQENQSKLPRPLRIIRGASMMIGLVCVCGILRGLGGDDGVTLAQAYENAGWVFWIAGVCLAVWGLLTLWAKYRERTVVDSDETKRVISTAERLTKNSYAELGVPETAANIDILMFQYVEKKGKIVPHSFGPAAFIACDCKAFTQNGFLCLADADQRYDFPLSEMRCIVTVKKNVAIPAWNKNIPTNKPPYKEYKLRIDDYGCIHFKPYYILELEHNGETWGIYFPSYELPTIERLTGHHPEQND